MGLLPRDIRDIRKMTKSELLQIERKLNKSMDSIYDKDIKDEVFLEYEKGLQKKYNKPASIASVVSEYAKEKNKIKKYIYDCEFCADAKFERRTENRTGEDIDYYKGDCGQAVCKYRDEIVKDVSKPREDIFKKIII